MLSKSQIKDIQSLGHKKQRALTSLFLAEGTKVVDELLSEAPGNIKKIVAVKEWIDERREVLKSMDVAEVTEDVLKKIAQLSTPNKVLAVVEQWKPKTVVPEKNNFTLVLDAIHDPGNMGSIVRNADWFGVRNIVCSKDCVDCYNPKVVQSTMASIARVNIFYTEVEEWLIANKDQNIYAAVLNGVALNEIEKAKEGILVIGNESKGISPTLLELVHKKITIPQKGKAESLNAAVASGILLFHLVV